VEHLPLAYSFQLTNSQLENPAFAVAVACLTLVILRVGNLLSFRGKAEESASAFAFACSPLVILSAAFRSFTARGGVEGSAQVSTYRGRPSLQPRNPYSKKSVCARGTLPSGCGKLVKQNISTATHNSIKNKHLHHKKNVIFTIAKAYT
jgi:hypothetical protein